jgi:WD40 repeat protein
MSQSLRYLVIVGAASLLAQARAGTADVSALQYNGNGQVVAAGYEDGRIALLERASGKTLWELPATDKQILSLCFRDKDKQLIAFERHGLIRCLEVATGRELKKLRPQCPSRSGVQAGIALAEFDQPSDLLVLAGDGVPYLYLINAARAFAGPEELPLEGKGKNATEHPALELKLVADVLGDFTNMCFSSKYGLALAVAEVRPEERLLFFIWKLTTNPSTGERQASAPVMREYGRTDDSSTGLAIGAGGTVVTVGYTKKYGGIQLWDLAHMELISWPEYFHPGGTANRAVFSHSGDIVITSDEVVNCVWQKKAGKLELLGRFWHGAMTTFHDRPNAIAFSPDDRELAVGLGPVVGLTPVGDLRSVKYIGKARPAPGKSPLTGE